MVSLEWRAASKPWSQVSTRLADTQLQLLEQGHHILDLLEQGRIQMDAELYDYTTQLVRLMHRLSDCSFFVASGDSNSCFYGKADCTVEDGDLLCLLSDLDKPSILRPTDGAFKLIGFAHVPSLSPPDAEIMYGEHFHLTVKCKPVGDNPHEDGSGLEA
ncbi:hypothetical protein K431DRAFT_288669 [Polychaeton citri CBS 116435]|uniref:Uncharacterized protein n=1 Tax=Polychaeton citri CBS 116435 TaxID=1314669 RepID=A0A9P4Q2J1_9PEZI|nr:hypothetical protein K431DRAFT_288669 [Polychaeton citri CBS 116435]